MRAPIGPAPSEWTNVPIRAKNVAPISAGPSGPPAARARDQEHGRDRGRGHRQHVLRPRTARVARRAAVRRWVLRSDRATRRPLRSGWRRAPETAVNERSGTVGQLRGAVAERLEYAVELPGPVLRAAVRVFGEPRNHVFPDDLAGGRRFEQPARRRFGDVRVAVRQALRVPRRRVNRFTTSSAYDHTTRCVAGSISTTRVRAVAKLPLSNARMLPFGSGTGACWCDTTSVRSAVDAAGFAIHADDARRRAQAHQRAAVRIDREAVDERQ